MEIWAHTLVKNEARWLWFSVCSAIDYVDKLLLWDSGSTDGSLELERELKKRYPGKIILRQRSQESAEDFTTVRQEMLEATKSDWFLMLDGDEIWWQDSISSVIRTIKNYPDLESVVVPTINLVGDIFHYQGESAGRYHLAGKVGHYNLRAVNRKIPGLKSLGPHGVWGWADGIGHMIQDRDPDKIKYINAPYLHASFLPRGESSLADRQVVKRSKKYKHELGKDFPKDFFYPEVLFEERPGSVPSPWEVRSSGYKVKAFFETPLRKIKRGVWQGRAGY